MNKPTTIEIPDYITDYIRCQIQNVYCPSLHIDIQHNPNPTFRPAAMRGLQAFRMRPVYAPDQSVAGDLLRMFHIEFGEFSMLDDDPQISCQMIGHVFWNATIKQELVSIRWRFNLITHEQTNAYVTYL